MDLADFFKPVNIMFNPEHLINRSGRSSDLLPFQAPSRYVHKATVAGLPEKISGDYSSGYCPGFSPGSLLIPITRTDYSETDPDANIDIFNNRRGTEQIKYYYRLINNGIGITIIL